MKRDKTTFILSTEYINFTDGMTDAEAGALFKAILNHENGVEVEEVPAEIRAVWSFIKTRLDNNKAAYEEACEAHREARTNGNKNNKKEQKVTNENKKEQKVSNDNKQPIDNDNENDKDSTLKPQRTQASLVGESELSDPVKEKLLEWLKYKKERREGYKETGLRALISEVRRHEVEDGADTVIAVINESMSNGWRGIIWEKAKGISTTRPPVARSGTSEKIHSFEERKPDFSDLERKLIKNL